MLRLSCALTVMVLLLATARAAGPDTFVWTGAGLDNRLSNPANWRNGAVPQNHPDEVIQFGAASQQVVALDTTVSINDIFFAGDLAREFRINRDVDSPNALLKIFGNVGSAAGSSQTVIFDAPVKLMGSYHFYELYGADVTHAASISGAGHLTLDSERTRTLTLATANTYTGGTTVLSGNLVAGHTQSLGTGAVTLDGGKLIATSGVSLSNVISFGSHGGTLGGSGTFNRAIVAGRNVVVAPGGSIGALTFGSGLTLAGQGAIEFEMQSAAGAPGMAHDTVVVHGSPLRITANSSERFTLRMISQTLAGTAGAVSDFNSDQSYSWLLVTASVAISSFSADAFAFDTTLFSNDLKGGTFSIAEGLNGSDPALFLHFTPVPEPSTYLLFALGLSALAWNRFRRRA